MAVLTAHHLTKVFPGGIRAVDDFSLEVAEGELLVLVGPSGCGKTTVLRMIAGLETPTTGTITIGGRKVDRLPPKDRDLAMVFQHHALYPHMTVARNMGFGLKMRRVDGVEIDRRVREAAELLGIGDLLRRRPGELSGGQRQRVALGRAMVRKPRVFLFDEPLSNLDAELRHQMRAEIRRLHEQLGTATVYVTHDQTEAMTLGGRIAVMRAGRLQQTASAMTLYDRPANRFVAGFVGSPAMNFLEGQIRRTADTFAFDEGSFSLSLPKAWSGVIKPYAGKPILMGLRPEHLDPTGAADTPCIAAKVEAVETLGHETHVLLSTSRHTLVCRTGPTYSLRVGDQIQPAIAIGRLHFFDPSTGDALEES
ncbi:MAG TPA: sn-glycerol-3-phosphate ABC transporter ATP-binding protein UgpC [Thermoguttaceae bacterium]|nr:sn-glycerol-3-phosphate ABC transporter ATP-binding protein UgpC [Thermoguttaceae bacterium]